MIITCPSCSTRYPVEASSFAPSGRKVRCAKCGHSWHQAPPTDLPRKIDLEAEEVPAKRQPERMQTEARSQAQAAQPEPAQETRAPAASPRDEPETPPAASAAAEPVAEAVAEAIRAVSQAGATSASASASQLGSGGRLRAFLDQAASTRRGRVVAVIGWAALIAFVAGTLYGAFRFREDIAVLWPTTAKLYAAVDKPVNLRGIEFRNVAYERQAENGLPVLAVKGEIVNVSRERRVLPRLGWDCATRTSASFITGHSRCRKRNSRRSRRRNSQPACRARLSRRAIWKCGSCCAARDAASLPVQEGEEAPAVRSR